MSSTRVADDRRKAASVVVSVLATLVLMSVMLAAIGRKMSAVASMVAATLVAVVGAMVMSSADERCDDKGGRRDGGRLAEVAMRGDNNDDDVSFLGDSDDDAFGGDELDGHPMGSAFDADSDDETSLPSPQPPPPVNGSAVHSVMGAVMDRMLSEDCSARVQPSGSSARHIFRFAGGLERANTAAAEMDGATFDMPTYHVRRRARAASTSAAQVFGSLAQAQHEVLPRQAGSDAPLPVVRNPVRASQRKFVKANMSPMFDLTTMRDDRRRL